MKSDRAEESTGRQPSQTRSLALDFANTAGVPGRRRPDAWRTPADLLAWLDARVVEPLGLEPSRASFPDAVLLFGEARRLREHVGHALEAFRRTERVPSDALHGIDRVLAASRVSRRLVSGPAGTELVEVETGSDPLSALVPVALAAARLLTTEEPKRLRRCASADCSEWFLDTSKAGRRKWCSMGRCGNRAKAARHRRKLAASSDSVA